MMRFDLLSNSLQGSNEVLKISRGGQKIRTSLKRPFAVFGGNERENYAEVSCVIDEPSVYVVPKGVAYGGLFVEHNGDLLTFGDILPTYIAAKVASGEIDIQQHRLQRTNEIKIDGVGVIINSISHEVYGHWLLDIWPRFWNFKRTLGDSLSSVHYLLAHGSPDYAIPVLEQLGLPLDRIVRFDHLHDRVVCKTLIVPSLMHNSYNFHPDFLNYIGAFRGCDEASARRSDLRVFLSRKNVRSTSKSVRRDLQNETEIESLFVDNGFSIIHPETLSMEEKVDLFRRCTIVAGEAGSGLHNSVFAREGTVVLSLGLINEVQQNISELFNQKHIVIHAKSEHIIEGAKSSLFELPLVKQAIDHVTSL